MVQPETMSGDGFIEIIKPHHLLEVHLNQLAHHQPGIAVDQPKRC